MPRPSKPKRVEGLPRCSKFFGENSRNGECHTVLSVEEFETIRLIDYLGMNQEECALSMNVSRITVQTLYSDARKKLARFLVEGNSLSIEGGNFVLADNVSEGHREEGTEDNGHKSICVTYGDGKVFQHFGRSQQLKVYEVENHRIVSSRLIDTEGRGHGRLVDFIKELSVDVVICGGIGTAARNALTEASIQLFAGAAGDADAQVESYLKGSLAYDPEYRCLTGGFHEKGECAHYKMHGI